MLTLPRTMEDSFWMLELSASFSSTRRVTSCSTFSALAPGQVQTASAIRMGISGSLRLGICR